MLIFTFTFIFSFIVRMRRYLHGRSVSSKSSYSSMCGIIKDLTHSMARSYQIIFRKCTVYNMFPSFHLSLRFKLYRFKFYTFFYVLYISRRNVVFALSSCIEHKKNEKKIKNHGIINMQ